MSPAAVLGRCWAGAVVQQARTRDAPTDVPADMWGRGADEFRHGSLTEAGIEPRIRRVTQQRPHRCAAAVHQLRSVLEDSSLAVTLQGSRDRSQRPSLAAASSSDAARVSLEGPVPPQAERVPWEWRLPGNE